LLSAVDSAFRRSGTSLPLGRFQEGGAVPSTPYTPQLRPLSIGEVLDAGFRLLRARFGTLMLCVLAAGLPLSIARTIIVASTDPIYYDVNEVRFGDPPTEVVVGQIVATLVLLLGALLAIAACFRVISAAYLGEPMKATTSLKSGLARIPALVIAFLVLGIVILFLVGVSAQIFVTAPLVFWLGVKWALVAPVIVAERTGPFRAMRRSWQLTRNNWWRAFAILIVVTLISAVLYFALVFALYAAFSGIDSINEIALATVDTLFNVVTLAVVYPLNAAILTVLYYDTRVRNEGFDLQLLAESIGSDGSRFATEPERPESIGGLSAPRPVPASSPSSGGFAPPEGPASTP
jgi:glycerophosphoryl diester phosphodiesterase family protein